MKFLVVNPPSIYQYVTGVDTNTVIKVNNHHQFLSCNNEDMTRTTSKSFFWEIVRILLNSYES